MSPKGTQPEKILETAYFCMEEKGYANVSLRDIAFRAGVALSQLNYHFESKEGLFVAVMKKALDDLMNDISPIILQDVSPVEKVRLLSEYCNAITKENMGLPRLFFDFAVQSIWNPAFKILINSFFSQVRALITSLICEFQANSGPTQYTDQQLSRFLLGAFLGTIGQRIWDTDSADDSGEFEVAELLFQ